LACWRLLPDRTEVSAHRGRLFLLCLRQAQGSAEPSEDRGRVARITDTLTAYVPWWPKRIKPAYMGEPLPDNAHQQGRGWVLDKDGASGGGQPAPLGAPPTGPPLTGFSRTTVSDRGNPPDKLLWIHAVPRPAADKPRRHATDDKPIVCFPPSGDPGQRFATGRQHQWPAHKRPPHYGEQRLDLMYCR
jgi:hypothetical protein